MSNLDDKYVCMMMGLYIGDKCHFVNTEKHFNKVDLVINCGYDDRNIDKYFPETKYLFLRFKNDKFDAPKLFKIYQEYSLLEGINNMLLDGKKVLILGDGGFHRPAAIVGSYFVRFNHFTPDYAEEFISGKLNNIYEFGNNFRETLNMVFAKK